METISCFFVCVLQVTLAYVRNHVNIIKNAIKISIKMNICMSLNST